MIDRQSVKRSTRNGKLKLSVKLVPDLSYVTPKERLSRFERLPFHTQAVLDYVKESKQWSIWPHVRLREKTLNNKQVNRGGGEMDKGQRGRLESLGELVHLWRRGTEKYSLEFLAATICADLGRRRRLLQTAGAGNHPGARASLEDQVKEAEELLLENPRLAECAFAYAYAPEMLEAIRKFIDAAEWRLTDEELADEGLKLLFDFDSLHLILEVVSQAPLSPATRKQLDRQQQIFHRAAHFIDHNRDVFFAASSMVNGYCLAWNVEEENVLSKVACLGSREADLLWEELNRAPEPVPVATPECPDENFIVLTFVGQLSPSEQEMSDRHLKSCIHCRGVLDLLTATFVQLPARLPPAPQEALPQELRQRGFAERLLKSLQQITEQVTEQIRTFVVPSFVLAEPTLVRGVAASTPTLRFDEILRRDVLIESPDVQAVLFLRGHTLYLSILVDPAKTVRALRLTDIQTGSVWLEEERPEEGGEIRLGSASSLCGKQVELSFRVGKRRYQTRVQIREQGGSQE